MKREDYQQVKEIFQSAIEVVPENRADFLDQACSDDGALRSEVEQLLEAHDSGFMNVPANAHVAGDTAAEEHRNAPTKTDPDFESGTRFGHYTIIARIGKGGMGDVYVADDLNLNRNVAIKFLTRQFTEDSERLKRFIHEAKSASSLNHPNIITVHEIGEQKGNYYIVSELVEGTTLAKVIEQGNVEIGSAVSIATQIASALAAAHGAGIIHRDIKPENIMLRPDGIVKILDFGLAKSTGRNAAIKIQSEAKTRARISTIPGMVMGTPGYMSPEQAKGREVDNRTDIFSFGVLFFELITGHLPFKGESAVETLAAILYEAPVPIEAYIDNPPGVLTEILKKTLSKKKEERYEGADALLIDLKDLDREFAEEPSVIQKRTDDNQPRTTVLQTERTWLWWANGYLQAAVAILLFAGVAASVWWYLSDYTADSVPAASGSFKTVEITNWASAAGELSSNASFSPDGSYVAYGSTKTGTLSIWVAQTNSGEAIQVTKDEFYNRFPVWSPNGEELAFYSFRGDNHGIWRVSALGGQLKSVAQINDAESELRYWSKSGRIYYQGTYNLFALDDATGESTQITKFSSSGKPVNIIQISRDESKIAFVIEEDDKWKIKVSKIGEIGAREIISSPERISDLVWHPDGNRLLFSRLNDGVHQIFETDMDGNDPTPISFAEKDSHVQDVSPDGSRILLSSATENSDLWKVDIDNSKESIVAASIDSELWADASPDNKTIVFQSIKNLSKGNKIYAGSIMAKSLPADDQPVLLAGEGFLPQWSSDGESLAFLRRVGQDFEIWKVGSMGGPSKRLSANGIQSPSYAMTPYNMVHTNHISWSPNSETIVYPATRDGKSNLWLVSADGSVDKQLTNNNDKNLRIFCPVWASDGNRIAFTSNMMKRNSKGELMNQLWVKGPGSAEAKRLFETKDKIRLLGFSKSEEEVIYAVWKGTKTFTHTPREVYIQTVSLKTGENRTVNTLNFAYFYNIHLAPDRKTIGFTSRSTDHDEIWITPVNDGNPRRLTVNNDPRLYYSNLSWSAAGKSILFGKQTRFSLLSMIVKSNPNGENNEQSIN